MWLIDKLKIPQTSLLTIQLFKDRFSLFFNINLQTIIVGSSWLQKIKMWVIIHDSFLLRKFKFHIRIYPKNVLLHVKVSPSLWFWTLSLILGSYDWKMIFFITCSLLPYKFHNLVFVLQLKIFNFFLLISLYCWVLFGISSKTLYKVM